MSDSCDFTKPNQKQMEEEDYRLLSNVAQMWSLINRRAITQGFRETGHLVSHLTFCAMEQIHFKEPHSSKCVFCIKSFILQPKQKRQSLDVNVVLIQSNLPFFNLTLINYWANIIFFVMEVTTVLTYNTIQFWGTCMLSEYFHFDVTLSQFLR